MKVKYMYIISASAGYLCISLSPSLSPSSHILIVLKLPSGEGKNYNAIGHQLRFPLRTGPAREAGESWKPAQSSPQLIQDTQWSLTGRKHPIMLQEASSLALFKPLSRIFEW